MLQEQGLDFCLPQNKFREPDVFWRKGCVWVVVISNALQKCLNHIFGDKKSLEIILPTYEKERKITFWKILVLLIMPTQCIISIYFAIYF
jgi:hypothetical protein